MKSQAYRHIRIDEFLQYKIVIITREMNLYCKLYSEVICDMESYKCHRFYVKDFIWMEKYVIGPNVKLNKYSWNQDFHAICAI